MVLPVARDQHESHVSFHRYRAVPTRSSFLSFVRWWKIREESRRLERGWETRGDVWPQSVLFDRLWCVQWPASWFLPLPLRYGLWQRGHLLVTNRQVDPTSASTVWTLTRISVASKLWAPSGPVNKKERTGKVHDGVSRESLREVWSRVEAKKQGKW